MSVLEYIVRGFQKLFYSFTQIFLASGKQFNKVVLTKYKYYIADILKISLCMTTFRLDPIFK